jgi:hypothetical protein
LNGGNWSSKRQLTPTHREARHYLHPALVMPPVTTTRSAIADTRSRQQYRSSSPRFKEEDAARRRVS